MNAGVVNTVRPLRVAVLVKQVPAFDGLRLGSDGRLDRTGAVLEMNPYCRRAVSQGVQIATESGGRCVVFALGPPSADDCLREAIAWGADEGFLITDPVLAGSDTLATAQALAAALRRAGHFDLVLCGRNSVDAETGQTPAQIAELLDLPMAGPARELAFDDGDSLVLRCELDDGWMAAQLVMPALVTCAERLIGPAKASEQKRAAVPEHAVTRWDVASLGLGPESLPVSMTKVGSIRTLRTRRSMLRVDGDVEEQVRAAVAVLTDRRAFEHAEEATFGPVPRRRDAPGGPPVAVLMEPGGPDGPDGDRSVRELLGTACLLAEEISGQVVALGSQALSPWLAGSWGADQVVVVHESGGGSPLTSVFEAQDEAAAFATWAARREPWAVLAPSTPWGREVAGRMAARLGAGLVGDAVSLDVGANGRLSCWKSAFGGESLAEVTCLSSIQMATVRSGVLPLLTPRSGGARRASTPSEPPSSRLRTLTRHREISLDALTTARTVVCLGAGVPKEDYPLVAPLLDLLGAELAVTRKVADLGWQPRARQVGITGLSLAPRLVIVIGSSGRFNHMAGVRGAHSVLAINNDPAAPVFEASDVGILADWRSAVPRLVEELRRYDRVAGDRQPAWAD